MKETLLSLLVFGFAIVIAGWFIGLRETKRAGASSSPAPSKNREPFDDGHYLDGVSCEPLWRDDANRSQS